MKLKLGQSKAVLNEERWCSHHRAYYFRLIYSTSKRSRAKCALNKRKLKSESFAQYQDKSKRNSSRPDIHRETKIATSHPKTLLTACRSQAVQRPLKRDEIGCSNGSSNIRCLHPWSTSLENIVEWLELSVQKTIDIHSKGSPELSVP